MTNESPTSQGNAAMLQGKLSTKILLASFVVLSVTMVIACCVSSTTAKQDITFDIFDLAAVGQAVGSVQGDSNYRPLADINNDGKVDTKDLDIVGDNYLWQ